MQIVYKVGGIEIWAVTECDVTEYFVYGVTSSGDPIICPSLGMAREVAAR